MDLTVFLSNSVVRSAAMTAMVVFFIRLSRFMFEQSFVFFLLLFLREKCWIAVRHTEPHHPPVAVSVLPLSPPSLPSTLWNLQLEFGALRVYTLSLTMVLDGSSNFRRAAIYSLASFSYTRKHTAQRAYVLSKSPKCDAREWFHVEPNP